jgi:hypothetical protein
MPRAKVVELPLLTGAVTDDTVLASKFYATDMDKVRARGKRWETIKGWTPFALAAGVGVGTFFGMAPGIARGIHAYADLKGNPVLVAASDSAFVAWMGGNRIDITPKWKDVWLDAALSLKGTIGTLLTLQWNIYQPSTGVSVLAPHDLVVGDVVGFTGPIQLFGTPVNEAFFTVVEIIDIYQFKIDLKIATIVTADARPFVCTVAFRPGLVDGSGDTPATRPRAYSIDNFGENAVFCGSDGTPVWAWQPAASTPNIIINSTFEAKEPWIGGAWTVTGGVVTLSGTDATGDLTYDVSGLSKLTPLAPAATGKLEGGKTYELSFQVTAVSNISLFRVLIDTIDIWPKVISTTWATSGNAVRTYKFRFVCPANPLQLIFRATTLGSGSISLDNITLTQLQTAFPINEAPQKNYALFVDGNHILTVLGSVEADGDFNPMLMRWCDIDNYRDWVPTTSNVAGELSLGVGSRAVCGAQVGQRNLILSDEAAFVASFTSSGYTLQTVATGCGAMATRGMAVMNARAYWASNKSICYYDGQQVVPLECAIKSEFAGKISQYNENKIFAWRNVEYNEIWIHYPHADDGVEVSRYILLNLLDPQNPWAFGTMNRTCMVKAGTFRTPIGIDILGNVWNHDTGADMPGGLVLPFVESGFITAEAGDRWVGCRRYYPDIADQIGNVRFTVTGKRAPQGQSNTQVIGPLVMVPNKRTVDFLLSCRQMKFQWRSEATPTNWRLGIVGLEMKPGGARK